MRQIAGTAIRCNIQLITLFVCVLQILNNKNSNCSQFADCVRLTHNTSSYKICLNMKEKMMKSIYIFEYGNLNIGGFAAVPPESPWVSTGADNWMPANCGSYKALMSISLFISTSQGTKLNALCSFLWNPPTFPADRASRCIAESSLFDARLGLTPTARSLMICSTNQKWSSYQQSEIPSCHWIHFDFQMKNGASMRGINEWRIPVYPAETLIVK